MFHRARDASKIALVHLVARLRAGGYRLLDTQYVTDHLKTFGAVEVAKRRYHRLLEEAIFGDADFGALPLERPVSGAEALAHLRNNPQTPLAQRRQGSRLLRARRRRRCGGTARAAAWAGGGADARGFRHARILPAFAVGQPHVVDRMLDRVQAGARREHPAGEDALDLALQRHLVDFDEGVGVRASRSAGANSTRAASPAARRTARSR